MLLSNVVAIVSGGSSGLGGATVREIVRHGGKCIVADLPQSITRFHDLVDRIRMDQGEMATPTTSTEDMLVFAETDVTRPDQISAALDMAETNFGEPVNVAVSCAGVAPAKKTVSVKKDDGTIRVHPVDVFSHTLDVNVTGTFNLARLSAERMLSRAIDESDNHNNNNIMRGCIINTASISAYEGQVGQVAYSASKGAVVGMTLPMARDLAEHKIRVMTIAPGLFLTPLLEGLPPAVKDGKYESSQPHLTVKKYWMADSNI
jgi:3-hydroxyacyl-CoA dehydrogenase / 3-hydroxy-2-methylbutyryl-CoA dehydrogenase